MQVPLSLWKRSSILSLTQIGSAESEKPLAHTHKCHLDAVSTARLQNAHQEELQCLTRASSTTSDMTDERFVHANP